MQRHMNMARVTYSGIFRPALACCTSCFWFQRYRIQGVQVPARNACSLLLRVLSLYYHAPQNLAMDARPHRQNNIFQHYPRAAHGMACCGFEGGRA